MTTAVRSAIADVERMQARRAAEGLEPSTFLEDWRQDLERMAARTDVRRQPHLDSRSASPLRSQHRPV